MEPLGETGRWFRRQYALTPPTSVCALAPFGQRQAQSIWFDCKAYRLNLYGDASGIRIRDLFCFDQDYPERYLAAPCQTDAFIYDTPARCAAARGSLAQGHFPRGGGGRAHRRAQRLHRRASGAA
ncbi:MAG: hypothetical protein SOX25_03120 [Eubacteriales bacterium]|nr:hypothetical protein [Eubacteriales bacterium]